jgi:DNA/RNA-binding domain of Phe-tRNA-synthetase-like protein
MWLRVDPELSARFPDLRALLVTIRGVEVRKESPELEDFKHSELQNLRASYSLDSLKDRPVFRAYRDFYWRIGIDPTKTRPSGEALLRRIVAGKPFPRINTLVDAYNLASARTGVAIGVFDRAKIKGDLILRTARPGESFRGIGMREPETLKGNEPVVSDDEKLIAIYPYRDSDDTKVTERTTDALAMICGVPGIPEETLRETAELVVRYITRFCGGRGEVL